MKNFTKKQLFLAILCLVITSSLLSRGRTAQSATWWSGLVRPNSKSSLGYPSAGYRFISTSPCHCVTVRTTSPFRGQRNELQRDLANIDALLKRETNPVTRNRLEITRKRIEKNLRSLSRTATIQQPVKQKVDCEELRNLINERKRDIANIERLLEDETALTTISRLQKVKSRIQDSLRKLQRENIRHELQLELQNDTSRKTSIFEAKESEIR